MSVHYGKIRRIVKRRFSGPGNVKPGNSQGAAYWEPEYRQPRRPPYGKNFSATICESLYSLNSTIFPPFTRHNMQY